MNANYKRDKTRAKEVRKRMKITCSFKNAGKLCTPIVWTRKPNFRQYTPK